MEVPHTADPSLQSRRSYATIREVTEQLSYLIERLTAIVASENPQGLSVVGRVQAQLLSMIRVPRNYDLNVSFEREQLSSEDASYKFQRARYPGRVTEGCLSGLYFNFHPGFSAE